MHALGRNDTHVYDDVVKGKYVKTEREKIIFEKITTDEYDMTKSELYATTKIVVTK